LLNADTTVDAWIDKAFTVPTNHAPIFGWQSQLGSHCDSSRNLNVTLRQFMILTNHSLSETKKGANPLQSDLLSLVHFVKHQ
jgi:hypothetical protein